MITLIYPNGQEIKTRCTIPARAISKALELSPVKGSITGTKLAEDGKVFGVITDSLGWQAVDDELHTFLTTHDHTQPMDLEKLSALLKKAGH